MNYDNRPSGLVPAREFAAFCSLILVMPILGVMLVLAYARSDFFLQHKGGLFLAYDHAYSFRGSQCEVLLFGDSTAITGLNPDSISSESHLRTCNIAQTRPQFTVLGTETLDTFLERNAQPRYIVIQLAADGFRIDRNWEGGHYGDGMLTLLRHRPPREVLRTLSRHPVAVIQFAGWIFSTLPHTAVGMMDKRRRPQSTRHAPNGFTLMPLPPETSCLQGKDTIPDPSGTPDLAWISALRHQYAQRGTKVLVDVSPMPSCDKQWKYYTAALAGITDNKLERYPVSFFNDGDRHFALAGSALRSHEVAQQVLELESKGKDKHAF